MNIIKLFGHNYDQMYDLITTIKVIINNLVTTLRKRLLAII